jgi:hypothetical protein
MQNQADSLCSVSIAIHSRLVVLHVSLICRLSSASDWSEFRPIDIHAHIGTFRGYDLSLGTLLTNMQSHGVRMAFISNIEGAELPGTTANLDEVRANQATLDVVKQHPDKLRGLVWTRPNDGSPKNVEKFLGNSSWSGFNGQAFVGMKFHPEMNHFPADDERVDPYLALCEKFSVPAVFHSGRVGSESEPKRIYAVARRHPKVAVILYHMGFGGQHDLAIQVAKDALKKGDARLYLETSQANVEAVVRAIRVLGSQRVLFGTDATYFGRQHYVEYERFVARLKKELSDDDFANLMHANAERLFPLK